MLVVVYLNSLLAALNARDKLREGFFGGLQHPGGTAAAAAGPQPQRIRPSQVSAFLANSFAAAGSAISTKGSVGEKVSDVGLFNE